MLLDQLAGLFGRGAFTRRQHIQGIAGMVYAATTRKAHAANQDVVYGQATIPAGIRSRFAENINGLRVHFLDAGFESRDRPSVLLLHAFPELAYGWRNVMLPLENPFPPAVITD